MTVGSFTLNVSVASGWSKRWTNKSSRYIQKDTKNNFDDKGFGKTFIVSLHKVLSLELE